ncbi:MAG: radical SAM protein [Armatimonadetes bacterium]|nr:radical SAM protein [Armatimonadota bacterium]
MVFHEGIGYKFNTRTAPLGADRTDQEVSPLTPATGANKNGKKPQPAVPEPLTADPDAATREPERAEWTEPYNSFNSWKGLMYYPEYQGIVTEKFLPPIEASIDPTYVCNIDCVWCNSWRILHKSEKVGHKMTTEHLLNLCGFLADWGVRGFCFAGGGDPTLHPGMWEALKLIKDKGKQSSIITNGIEIRTEERRRLAIEGCRWIGISLDAGTRETYARIKKTSVKKFDMIVENVRAMIEMQKQTGARCEIAIKYLIHPSNEHEILQACQLAYEIGVPHFHARPAASENIEGLGEVLKFNMDLVNEQLAACMKMQTKDFKVFGVRHKFNETMNLKHGFSRCWAAPLTIQCGADGYVYNCVDWRGDPNYVLGMHYPDPSKILEFWGSPKHVQFLKDVVVDKCPRCTYGIYAQQIEHAVVGDDMCVNFP